MDPGKEQLYRCVYHAVDRHHVENHFHKAEPPDLSESPSSSIRHKSMVPRPGIQLLSPQQQYGRYQQQLLMKKRNGNRGNEADVEDDDEQKEIKKMRQDASLLQSFAWAENGDSNGTRRVSSRYSLDFYSNGLDPNAFPLPDLMKVEELMEHIEKKLQLPHAMVTKTVEKLHGNAFFTLGSLRSLKREGWTRLGLPLALEEEVKSQLSNKRNDYATCKWLLTSIYCSV